MSRAEKAHRAPPRAAQKLYISDLDGTLLLPDRTLGQRTRDTLMRFIAAGGLFTVATGRCAPSVAHILGALDLPCKVIVHNGALTLDLSTGEIGEAAPLLPDTGSLLFSQAISADLTPLAYALDPDGSTVLLHGPLVNGASKQYVGSLDNLLLCEEDDGEKLRGLLGLAFIFLDDPSRLRGFFADACLGDRGLTWSLGHSAYDPRLAVGEVQTARASKAQAALVLAAELGLRAEAIVAFGDNMNDLPLLLTAGLGLCPPGAVAEVLARVPNRIAGPAEEGVACYLQQVLEGGEVGQLQQPCAAP